MSGVTGFKTVGKPNITRIKRPAAKSTAYVAGDWCALSTLAGLTTSATPVVRPILAADIAANYKLGDGTTMAGLLGVALHTQTANTSGIIATQPAVTNVAASARPIYALPGYGAGQAVEPTIGHSYVQIVRPDRNTWFRMALLASIGVATPAMVGKPAGLDLTSGVYTVDTGATDKCFLIEDIDTEVPSSNIVWVSLLPSFDQGITGVPYAAQ